MNRRITAFFPFSQESTIYAGNGVSPIVTGTFAGEGLDYGKYEASDGSFVATLLPYTEGKDRDDRNSRSLSIDRSTHNLFTINPGQCFNPPGVSYPPGYNVPWSSTSGETTAANYRDGVFPDIDATYMALANTSPTPIGEYWFYAIDSTYQQSYTSAIASCYVHILNNARSNTESIMSGLSAYGDGISSANGWVRTSITGGITFINLSPQLSLHRAGDILQAQLLVTCAQFENVDSVWMGPTPFTSSTRPAGKVRIPKSVVSDTTNFTFATWFKYSYIEAGDSRLLSSDNVGTMLHIENNTSAVGSIGKGEAITVGKANRSGNLVVTLPITSGSDLKTTISTGWTASASTSADWRHIGLTVTSSQAIVYVQGVSASVITPPAGYYFRKFGKNRDILLGHDGSSLSAGYTSSQSFMNGALVDTLFADGIFSADQIADLYALGTSATTYGDLSHSSLPQPTVSITANPDLPNETHWTADGERRVNLISTQYRDKLQLHWGPLLESEIYAIKDFIDANGSRLAFWFTPPVGPRARYRFDPSIPITIDTSKPYAHEIKAAIVRVD